MGMESFKQRLSEYAVLTENTLQQYLPEEMEDIVTEAMRYSLLAGGKLCTGTGILSGAWRQQRGRASLCLCAGNGTRLFFDS